MPFQIVFFDLCVKWVPNLEPIYIGGFGAIWLPKPVQKNIPVANSISYLFCIDLDHHFDAFFNKVCMPSVFTGG